MKKFKWLAILLILIVLIPSVIHFVATMVYAIFIIIMAAAIVGVIFLWEEIAGLFKKR